MWNSEAEEGQSYEEFVKDSILDQLEDMVLLEPVSYTHLDVYKRQDVFLRIKIGVGEKPKGYDLADYVLGHFSREEREMMEEGYQKAAEAVEMILAGELDEAMNVFNRKAKPKEAIE